MNNRVKKSCFCVEFPRQEKTTIFQKKNNEQSYEIGLLYQDLPSATCGSRPEPNAFLAIPGTNLE